MRVATKGAMLGCRISMAIASRSSASAPLPAGKVVPSTAFCPLSRSGGQVLGTMGFIQLAQLRPGRSGGLGFQFQPVSTRASSSTSFCV